MKKIVLLLLLFSQVSLAQVIPDLWVQAEHKSVEVSLRDKTQYPMIRLKRAGATPVIFLHGIGTNAHNWMDLGPDLYKSGYDVWAFTWSANKNRNIDEAGTQTVKEIVDYVFRHTGKKAFLVGHSLGGIVSKIYILGIELNPITGEYFINKFKQRQAKRRLHGFVSISSPNGLDPEMLAKFLPLFSRLPTDTVPGMADLSIIINRDKLERDLYLVRLIEYNIMAVRLPLISNLAEFLFNPSYHSLFDYDLGRMTRYGFSPVPQPIIDQVNSNRTDFQAGDQIGDYSRFFRDEPRPIPFAFIAGESDKIAGFETIETEALEQGSPFLLIKDGGHLDPLMGKMRIETALFLNHFFRAP
tara:strand:+ start:30674 stop:31741 length:1068 start_codon:yes stop_codon:yes gene_type:complete